MHNAIHHVSLLSPQAPRQDVGIFMRQVQDVLNRFHIALSYDKTFSERIVCIRLTFIS